MLVGVHTHLVPTECSTNKQSDAKIIVLEKTPFGRRNLPRKDAFPQKTPSKKKAFLSSCLLGLELRTERNSFLLPKDSVFWMEKISIKDLLHIWCDESRRDVPLQKNDLLPLNLDATFHNRATALYAMNLNETLHNRATVLYALDLYVTFHNRETVLCAMNVIEMCISWQVYLSGCCLLRPKFNPERNPFSFPVIKLGPWLHVVTACSNST